MTVNYGSPTVARHYELTQLAHVGDTGHDLLAHGDQCECGVVNIGTLHIPRLDDSACVTRRLIEEQT